MLARLLTWVVALSLFFGSNFCLAEDVLFKDSFDKGLSDQWQIVGLRREDYRVRDGALEMRVQPGKLTAETAMLKVLLPFDSTSTVAASVKVTLLDEFKDEQEFAGLFLVDEAGREFAAKQEFFGGKLVYSPGRLESEDEEEELPAPRFEMIYTKVARDAGPLRILVDRGYAFFQVGPSAEDKYLNFFYSAIRKDSKERGFALTAAGAPAKSNHWVRFDDFRVVRR